MKTSILLILQSVLLFAVLAILIDGLIRLPDIETIHIIIRAIGAGVVTGNFIHALQSYLNEK